MSEPRKTSGTRRRSRRDFLKTSATLVGGAAMSSALASRSVHAAGSDTIRLGLIGCGERGTGAAIQALNADRGARLIAMADVFEDHLRSSRRRLVERKPEQVTVDDEHRFVGFDGYRQVIESDVDAILIACASRFHPLYLKAAVQAGKHVFLEKPHAIDPPGAHMVRAACEEARERKLSVVSGLHRRYDPAMRETVQRVHDGAIGDIVAAEVSFLRAPYRIIPRDPKWSEIEWQFRTWYHFRWLSGDDVPQSLIHTADAATWALGDAPPLNAHGLGGRSASFGARFGDVFDHSTVVYEYPNGARMYGMVRTQHGCHGEVATKLFGTKGRAVRGRIEGETSWRFEGRNPGGHQQEQTEFLASIRSGKPINNGDYMVRSTLLTILGQMACYTGKKLTWRQVCDSSFSYPPGDGACVDFGVVSPVKPDPDRTYPVPVPGRTECV